MARVQGIISAGLASAGRAEELAEQDRAHLSRAEAAAAEVDRRTGAIAEPMLAGEPSDFLTSAAAGAGMGFVFGPIGALIGAGLAHMYNKKRRASILAYASQDAQSTQASLEQGRAALGEALKSATSDSERAEIEMMISEFNQYAELTNHPDQGVRSQGLLKALETSGTLDTLMDEWDEERIAAADRERSRLSSQFTTFDNLRGDLQRESQRFTLAREAWTSAHALAERGSPTDDIALIYKMANINDPGAIVTEGDVDVLKASGSITEQMAGYYNQFIRGEAQMDDNVRANIMATIDALYREQRDLQIDRNSEFQAIGEAAQLDPAYLQRLRIPIDPAEASLLSQTAEYVPDETVGRKRIPTEIVDQDGNVRANTTTERPGLIAQGVIGLGMMGQEFADSVGRHLNDQAIRVDQDTGERFVVDNDGQVVETLEPATRFQNADGDTIIRVDTPNGPTFRNMTQERRFQREPGLWQPGGYFDRRRQQREVNE